MVLECDEVGFEKSCGRREMVWAGVKEDET